MPSLSDGTSSCMLVYLRMYAALDMNRARICVRVQTHARTQVAHTWRDRTYMRYTYDLPESALRSTSEYITAAFVALIPIAERMRVSGAPPGYFCAVGSSPK